MYREFKLNPLIEDATLENYYPLNTLQDYSGRGRILTVAGTVSFASGLFQNAASATFSGNNNLTATTFAPGTGSASFGCWFKKNGVPTADFTPTIMMIGTTNRLYLVAQKDTGYAGFWSYDGSATGVWSTVNICDNNWHHVMVVRSGTSHYVYVDGVQVTSTTGTARNVTVGTLYLGNNDGSYDYIGACLIDDAVVFSKALSAAEVLSIYSLGIKKINGLASGLIKKVLKVSNFYKELAETPLLSDAALENYYKMEDNSDSSSKNRALTEGGTVNNVAGILGNCADCTWNSTNTLFATSFNIGTGNFSLGCWFKSSSISTREYEPYIMDMDNDTVTPRLGIVASRTTGYAYLQTYNSDPSSTSINSNINVCDGFWHHIVATRNGTSHKIYIDGHLANSVTGTNRNVPTSKVRFGYSGGGSGYDYLDTSASIDDAFVFSKELTAAEISSIYKTTYIKKFGGVSNA